MFRPDSNRDRTDYSGILMPPDGYRLDRAVGTTYSLDLEALTAVAIGEELQNDDTWDNMLALWKDTLVLDYYHPAVHYPNRVNYYALMAICDVARKKYGTPVWSEQNEKY